MDKTQKLWQPFPMPLNRNSLLYKTAARTAARVGIRYFDTLYGEKNLSGDIPVLQSSLDLEIREATEEEILTLARLQGGDMEHRFRFSIDHGGDCYIALANGEPAGYTWVNKDVMTMDMIKIIDVPPGGSFHFNSFVFAEFRGHKIFQNMISQVYRDLKNQGCLFTGNFVDRENTASIKARKHFSVLFQPVRVLRIPGLPVIPVGKRFVPGASLERS